MPHALHAIGRYALYDEIAAGGMAKVHLGRLIGPAGFSRTVAIKRLHPHFARDHEFVAMFLDEARLAARIRHPNVVPTLDVVSSDDELLLVMDYVHGDSLSGLVRAAREQKKRVPVPIAAAIAVGVLHGLHAAHEAMDEKGQPLHVVHRDVSPQNVLVGADGVARVVDFGVAKARGRSQTTGEGGRLKGKLAYMAPEQFEREPITPRIDVYAASVVLWELLTRERMFTSESDAGLVGEILYGIYRPARERNADVPSALDDVIAKGMARDSDARFASAREMALAIERCVAPASIADVGAWVAETATTTLERRAAMVAAMESGDATERPPPLPAPAADPTIVDRRDATAVTPVAVKVEASKPSRNKRLMFAGAFVATAIAAAAIASTSRSAPAPAAAPTTSESIEPSPAPPNATATATPTSTPTSTSTSTPTPTPTSPSPSPWPKPKPKPKGASSPRLPKGLPDDRN